jgi:GGDEF domain-containing protein
VLARVMRAVRRSLRAADMLFRHNNDEFVALLLLTGDATGRLIATRITEAVQSEQDVAQGPRHFNVTVTVVSAPENGRSVDELLAIAANHQRYSDGNSKVSGGNSTTSIH